ncbi:MAG: FtsX-like permease family protein [Acidobacteria bacterium]|nr:FtsX-like permease family protein [Acidobacteriota bacterium]
MPNLAFESFVARRYLTAKRRQAVISVITLLSIGGVAAGVMALIIALAITNGVRNTLQRSLLGATAHVSILEKELGVGLEEWQPLTDKLARIPHVNSATPVLYSQVLYSGPQTGQGGYLKGIPDTAREERAELAKYVKQGSLDRLRASADGFPPILLGAKLAQRTGMLLDSIVTVIIPNGEMTPMGARPAYPRFRVVGIFESGFFDVDNTFAYAALDDVQRVTGVAGAVNSIELKLDDVNTALDVAAAVRPAIGDKLTAQAWQEQNKTVLNALKMDRIVAVITISLIQLVGAMNILISLIMMVMEKTKDIAILVSMGARWEQVRRIFILQGIYIGALGTALGLLLGYGVSFAAEKGQWFRLDAEIYGLSHVPFEPRAIDAVWVSAAALVVSFLATLYPARRATAVLPAEALRYE